MKLFSNLKNKSVRTTKRLFAYDELQQGLEAQATVLDDLLKSNLEEVKPTAPKTYIPTDQVLAAQKNFKRMVAFFIGLFSLGILYFIANLIHKNWTTAVLSLAFCGLCLSFAFRYHFWLYQIKKKKLGLNFSSYYQEEIVEHWSDKSHGQKKPAKKDIK